MGFLISWDTVALINAIRLFSPTVISYIIWSEISMIYKIYWIMPWLLLSNDDSILYLLTDTNVNWFSKNCSSLICSWMTWEVCWVWKSDFLILKTICWSSFISISYMSPNEKNYSVFYCSILSFIALLSNWVGLIPPTEIVSISTDYTNLFMSFGPDVGSFSAEESSNFLWNWKTFAFSISCISLSEYLIPFEFVTDEILGELLVFGTLSTFYCI